MKDRRAYNARMSKLRFVPTRTPLKTHSRKQDVSSTPEDFRAQFFEHYRKEAEDYDKEFMKKYDEDLNTTLIFVSLRCDGWTCMH